jgi:DNA-binding winged helix-turn-helix (wHTH) protein
MPSGTKYRFDQYEADVSAAELRRAGTRLKLQLQPFQVLVALLERPHELVTREELRERLWPQDTFVDFDHGLNTAMTKVRDALGDSAVSPRFIETIAKRGYRFLGEVQVLPGTVRSHTLGAGANHADENLSARTNSLTTTGSALATSAAKADLPRAPRRVSRFLFVLAQVLYLIFYLSALFNLERLDHAAYLWWPAGGYVIFVIFLVTAMVGIAVRLYLITATAFDYHLLAEKYRVLFPALFILDMLWALGPFLLIERMGIGLALAAATALIYLPFAQRVLMKMIDRRV